ncbi:ATP-binding protein [Actinomadura rupiterrae]|uniref:ATP-binding protein n=1 Tax=Actinomadura rupiterrae TaxID=559627 RepID=UPI0020A59EC0|nr:ATP-binding protein [Actinomadura rupiterrae]MCP2342949.1 anti-sigma regulatory factor (Ser/Thr protein kinase) [Actinomadura rupiterrae]
MGTSTMWRYSTAAEWLHGPDPMRWRRTFSGDPEQVSAARRFARMMFAGEDCADVVEFVVGELAANTLRHTRSAGAGGWFGVELGYGDPVYVGITDMGGGGIPAVQPVDESRENGRGLYAVSQLSLALGIHGSPDLGHTVWADLDRHTVLETPPGLCVPLAS